MEFLKQRRGQIAGQLTGAVLAVIIVSVLLVVGTVIFAQLQSINTSSLGANANVTKMGVSIFDLMFTTQGIIVLVVVVTLLALVIYTVVGSIGGQGKGR